MTQGIIVSPANRGVQVVVTDENNVQLLVDSNRGVSLEIVPQPRIEVLIDKGVEGAQGPIGPQGPQGPQGTAATVTAGTTTTGAAGTNAIVTNAGTSSAAVFDFTIPRGDTGATGATGAGVAVGGTTGQVLVKASNVNYDTTWATITGTLVYQGSWNAATNTPTLTSSVGTNGYYYVVGTSGSTNLNGITDWVVGDWAIFNGTIWQKIDNTDLVSSVNGQTGVVVLTASSVGALSTITSADGSIVVTPSGTTVDLAVSAASPASTLLTQVRNTTGATLTKGTVVYISGATGQISTVSKALATGDATSAQTLGMMTSDLANNTNGYVTVFGLLQNMNTSAYTDGAQLYLSGTVAGTVTTTKPSAPIHLVYVGIVEYAHPTQGKILVKVQNGYELDEIHDVSIVTPVTGQTLVYNSITDLWVNNTVSLTAGVNGILPVANGGTGASTLTGYVKGSGTTPLTASSTIPNTDITGLGTISTQNANSVAITGGTINGTTVGATTPAAGTFTTLTAQTEVLKGTGQNYLTFSQAYTSGSWSLTNGVLTGSQTDPLGGSTAFLFAENTTNGTHLVQLTPSPTLPNGTIYTYSQFVKSAVKNQFVLAMSDNTTGQAYALFDTNAGTVSNLGVGITNIGSGSWTNISGTITSAGGGWYRCTLTATKNAGTQISVQMFQVTGNNVSYAGTTGAGVFIWGAQLELSSSVGTYIPTTTTAVYGTPTLSFSGVSTIGLESNGSLFVQPAGTGALQAQATTSSTVGGNARGANAVDWQTSRVTANQVASGQYSVTSGGYGNIASAFTSFVGGGYTNTASGYNATVAGGTLCVGSGPYSSVLGGYANTTSNFFAAISGGVSNTAAGYYNFIGGGFTNSGTALAAVTTQSATMNGTTAVTLAASNANIKVGQYITGTSIGADTYVAAISGTSLTLSKVASGSSTSTLSFFTPHGVVVGGGNNQATGSYSFIGGGGDAGTAANRNVASGDWSVVGGGFKNTASGLYSTVVGGYGNTSNNTGAFVGGGGFAFGSVLINSSQAQSSGLVAGIANNITGNAAFIGAGYSNLMNSQYSASMGGSFGNARSIQGNHVFPANVNPIAQASGITQSALLVLAVQTTDATATILRSDAAAAGTTNQVILPNNSAYYFKGSVIANVTGAANGAAWDFTGAIMRGANAASTVLIGTPAINRVAATAGATAWLIALTADTTNGGLAVTVTGAASTTIRWVASVNTVEVTF